MASILCFLPGIGGDVWQRPGWLVPADILNLLQNKLHRKFLHELGQVGMPTRSGRMSDMA